MNINKLRKIIELKKITQKEIAEKIGLSSNAFSAALKKGDFKVSMLEKIAEVLDVPVSYFFDESLSGGQIVNGSFSGNNISGNNISVKVNQQAAEIEHLKKELASCRELLKAKEEIIRLLKGK